MRFKSSLNYHLRTFRFMPIFPMKLFYLLISFFLVLPLVAQAQPANNDCATAIMIPEQLEYCSGEAAFTNVSATASLDFNDYPVCFDERDVIKDVWFSFVAQRNSVNIRVIGRTDVNPGGSLQAPQFALYEGGCAALMTSSVGCRSPFENPNTGQILNGGNIIFNGLRVGETYHILVGARFGNVGTFELCLDQFDEVPEPSGDCITGVILCDKSPFAVDLLRGTGDVNDDLLSDNINCGSNPQESNASWYRWTCDEAGSLEFTITPLGAAFNEDIDFVLYEMTGGLDDCGSRQPLRQMFSGETAGNGANNIPCLGETGIMAGDPDTSEDCGCQAGNNNFISSIDMVSGRSYALVIMNFTGSGDGFSLEFGGSGTFLGPEPDFTFSSNEVCVGEALTFQDLSTSIDEIVSREWSFGTTAQPRTATGPGPHSVVFGRAGSPSVELIITTSRDCREVLSQREVNVICCDGQFTGVGSATDVVCPADSTGSVAFGANSNFTAGAVTYSWSNGNNTPNLQNLTQGVYTVTVSDDSECSATFSFTVGGPPVFIFDTLITMPSCAGGTDGGLEFTVLSGGEGPYEYSIDGAPFGNNNRITDIPISLINIRARDANNCPIEQNIRVDELELGLVRGVDIFTEPVCADDANGSIQIELANGNPAFSYDFGLGDGFQPNNVRSGLTAGTYNVTARDADGCRGEFLVELTEPTAINLAAAGTGSTCFGTNDGQIVITANGGRPGYAYRWMDDVSTDSVRTNLNPGAYTVSLTDQNGCIRSITETITEPGEIFPQLLETIDLTCFGDPTGSFRLTATGGTPGYTYASDNRMFQTDSMLNGLLAGDYTLYVMDANGCTDSLRGRLTEPREFIVDAGNDGRIILGFDTTLRAVSNYNPVSFQWLPDDQQTCINPDCSIVRVGPVETTIYTVVGTNAAGCTDTTSLELQVIEDLPLYVPNAFSPNSDGSNDGFTVFGGPALEEIEVLRVFDRWGSLQFEGTNFPPNEPGLGWDGKVDGKLVNPAVFVYQASVRFVNGRVLEFAGDVTVVK